MHDNDDESIPPGTGPARRAVKIRMFVRPGARVEQTETRTEDAAVVNAQPQATPAESSEKEVRVYDARPPKGGLSALVRPRKTKDRFGPRSAGRRSPRADDNRRESEPRSTRERRHPAPREATAPAESVRTKSPDLLPLPVPARAPAPAAHRAAAEPAAPLPTLGVNAAKVHKKRKANRSAKEAMAERTRSAQDARKAAAQRPAAASPPGPTSPPARKSESEAPSGAPESVAPEARPTLWQRLKAIFGGNKK